MTTKGIGLCRTERVYTHGKTRIAAPTEALLGIQAKLLEECGELVKAPTCVSEYADVIQVVYDMAYLNGISQEAVKSAIDAKYQRAGGLISDVTGLALIWEPL